MGSLQVQEQSRLRLQFSCLARAMQKSIVNLCVLAQRLLVIHLEFFAMSCETCKFDGGESWLRTISGSDSEGNGLSNVTSKEQAENLGL